MSANLSLKRRIARALDRPGGRAILAAATSAWARHVTGDRSLSIIYDEMWIDVVDGRFLPRSAQFDYYEFDLKHMQARAKNRLSGALDYWTYIYKPRLGDTVIDVGAGIGIDTIALSPYVGQSGRIFAIEAHPWTFKALSKTKELNRLDNVEVFHLAIAEAKGRVWITNMGNDESNSISKSSDEEHRIEVDSIDLDTFVARSGIGRIDLLKLNIEGAESLAIRGMKECLVNVQNAAVACHDFRGDLGSTKSVVVDFFKANGFEVFERPNDSRPYVRDHIHAKRIGAV